MELYPFIDLNKAVINERHPLNGFLLSQIKNYYRIELTWSSNALEGNSFTKSETKVMLEDEISIGGKPLNDLFEVVGHAKAYDFMFTLPKNKTITESDILTMHQLFYQSIEREYAGKYRDVNVLISGSKYPVVEIDHIQEEMDKLFQWTATERGHAHPVAFAARFHERFSFICPFKNGNGRIARLIMNTVLMQDGYLPAVISPVFKPEYIGLLEKAHTDEKPFEQFIAERVLESQKEIMRLLHMSDLKPDGRIDMEL